MLFKFEIYSLIKNKIKIMNILSKQENSAIMIGKYVIHYQK